MTKQKIFLIGFVTLVLLIVAWYIIGCPLASKCPFVRFEKEEPPKVILTFVGPSDDNSDWREIFSKFNTYKKMPENGFLDVIIKYERICNPICDPGDYEDIVREKQFEDEGPNIFMAFNTRILEYKDKGKILSAPKGMMNLAEFENTFARVTKNDLTDEDGNIYALPFYVDTLALYYDEDAFLNKSLISPPKDWEEFAEYTKKLTILDKKGNLVRSGAAFGGGSNVNRSQDILMLLVMQNNIGDNTIKNITSFENEGSSAAVNFYTDFANPGRKFYTWNEDQIYSIDAFTQKKAVMMINYSHHIENVIDKTSNNLNFKIAPIPQLDENNKVNHANYWAPVVPKKAPCGKEAKTDANCYSLAWEFLNFAAKKENAKLYLDSTGKPAANLELAKEQFIDFNDMRSVFAGQVFTAKSWDHPNDLVSDKVLVRMIDSIITTNEKFKESVFEAMLTAARYIDSLNPVK
jgi:ABC-type glycerol-3-phosphate transport system substrate-binding protein